MAVSLSAAYQPRVSGLVRESGIASKTDNRATRFVIAELHGFLRLRSKPSGHQIFGAASDDQFLGRGT